MHRNGYSKALSIVNLAVVAWLGACGTDDDRPLIVFDPGPGTAGAGVPSSVSGFREEREAVMKEPFTLEFPALISQPVRWASVDVRITKVRQVRGVSDVEHPEYQDWLDPNQIYVQLELAIANKGAEETNYYDRATWDLKLADGTRLTSVNALGVSVLPGDEATTVVYYDVDEVVELAGAALVLEGAERGALEPEVLPLDVAYVPMFPRRIASLVAKEGRFQGAMIKIDEAVYDLNSARDGRATKNNRRVWVRVALTSALGGHYDMGDLRVAIDGRASSPEDREHDVVDAGTTRVFFASFEIDANAQRFDLVLPDDGPGNRFPVELAADAVLATDIP